MNGAWVENGKSVVEVFDVAAMEALVKKAGKWREGAAWGKLRSIGESGGIF